MGWMRVFHHITSQMVLPWHCAGSWYYLEAPGGNEVFLRWTQGRQRLDKAVVSIMKNPETEVPVSPGNHRGGESRAAGVVVRALKGG